MVARSRSESRLRASSKRLWLEEGLEVACGDDEAAALAFGELAATSPVAGALEDAGVGDEPRLVGLKVLRSRSRKPGFLCGMGSPDMFDDV